MSLVHQVLRNIDDRGDQDIVIVPEALKLEEKSPLNWTLISIAGVLVLIALIAVWLWQSQARFNSSNEENLYSGAAAKTENKTVIAEVQSELIEPVTPDIQSAVKTESVETLELSPADSMAFEESQVTPAAVKVVEEPVAESNVSESDQAKQIQRPAAEEGSHLLISQRDQQSHQQYSYMLTLMRQKQWAQAGDIAEKLLQSDGLDPSLKQKLLHNKLRILLEEKQFDQFLSFYNQHQGTDSIAWLSTAAPGLHMMAAYPQAAASYQRLIDKQPSVVNWPIALALVLEQQGQQQQAETLFNQILTGYSLQPGQRRWVENKLEGLR